MYTADRSVSTRWHNKEGGCGKERQTVSVDDFEVDELVVGLVDADDKEEPGVALVDDGLVVAPLDKVAHGARAVRDREADLARDALALLLRARRVPLAQADLALSVHQQEEVDLFRIHT